MSRKTKGNLGLVVAGIVLVLGLLFAVVAGMAGHEVGMPSIGRAVESVLE